jgi:hypothetical protein
VVTAPAARAPDAVERLRLLTGRLP